MADEQPWVTRDYHDIEVNSSYWYGVGAGFLLAIIVMGAYIILA